MRTIKNSALALKLIKENKEFNLKTSFGYVYFVGGILSKLEGGRQYISINEKWVEL
jgi:hypothetical protein